MCSLFQLTNHFSYINGLQKLIWSLIIVFYIIYILSFFVISWVVNGIHGERFKQRLKEEESNKAFLGHLL